MPAMASERVRKTFQLDQGTLGPASIGHGGAAQKIYGPAAIELIADRARLRQLDLVIPNDCPPPDRH